MSIEVLPLGMRCNIACTYCYQEPVREAGNAGHPRYDMDAMKTALLQQNSSFTLFGGEPLLMPLADLEELWRFGLEKFGQNSIQTNGTLITEEHIKLFKKYNVSIGLSVDGPDELNDARVCGEETRSTTQKSLEALDQLCQMGRAPSLIVTLHRLNASRERLPRFLSWLKELSEKGVRYVNLHLLEVDSETTQLDLTLSDEETVDALLSCARLNLPLTLQPLTHMLQLLRKSDAKTDCIWNACDPYTTRAVQGIDGQGHLRNCGRTYKEGVQFLKADHEGFERYLSLYYTPQEFGGCSGCRFFYACKGQCPGTGEKRDWRARTDRCSVLKRVFELLEAMLLEQGHSPLSLRPERLALEQSLVQAWQNGRTERAANAPHGDHTDAERPVYTHGDHTDTGVQWKL